jgi:PAS domain S-box-containing protein
VETIRKGATDFVLKGSSRLVPAVRRALQEAGNRRAPRKEKVPGLDDERFRRLAENARDMLYRMSLPEGRYEYVSPAATELSGYSPEEFYRTPLLIREIIHPEWRDYFEEQWADLLAGELTPTYEYQIVHRSGEPRWLHQRSTLIRDGAGKPVAVEGVVSDITDRKRTEEELRHANEQFRALIVAAPLAIFVLDTAGCVLLWNPAAEDIFGWSEAEVLGRPLRIVPWENAAEARLVRKRVLQGETLTAVPLQHHRRDGSSVDVSLYAAPIYDSRGTVVAIMAAVADTGEQKRVERELMQSEQRFRTAFEGAIIGMCLVATDGRFLTVNRSLCDMLGYTASELTALNHFDITHPEDVERRRAWSESLLRGEPCPSSMEFRCLHRTGRIVWAQVSKFLFRDNDGTPLYFVNQVQDITERKSLENQLRHSQKMEAIGTLTGGIAHDFNNILTAIIGYGSLLEMRLAEDDPLRPFVEHILTAGERAAGLTQSLLAFGRKQTIEPQLVDLNAIVFEVEKFLLRLLREDIDLRTSVANEVYTVMADAGQIEQVLMNLATNARDAMPDGGVLAISTGLACLDREFTATHGYGVPGRYAVIAVSDTGVGMDEETRLRIFEPFYTTKEVGKGTGLGLSIAYGIVKQHSGFVTCYSEPGKGTTFRIYLPAVDASADPLPLEAIEIPPAGTETILLAEDDEQVRALTRELLERFGYRVIEAVDGRDALVQFAAHQAQVRLALLDVIMPGRNGRDAYHDMKKLAPDLKVLFTSGYSADIFQRGEIADAGLPFICKPVVPSELLKAIRRALDE